MFTSRFARASVIAASLLALEACGSASVEPAQSAQAGLTRAPISAAAQLDGRMRAYAEAFAEVPLRDGQRAEIEKLLVEAQTRHEGMGRARADLSTAIAAQMRAGASDRAALAPRFEALAAERAKAEPLDHAAMERVHALLDASQREALVAAAQAKMHAEHHGERGQ